MAGRGRIGCAQRCFAVHWHMREEGHAGEEGDRERGEEGEGEGVTVRFT